MSLESEYEKEEIRLDEMLANGDITQAEYNDEVRQLRRDYRAELEDMAQSAYEDVIGRSY